MNKEDDTNSAEPPCKRLKQAQLTLFASKPSKVVEPAASKPSSSACSSKDDGDSVEAATPKPAPKPAIGLSLFAANRSGDSAFTVNGYQSSVAYLRGGGGGATVNFFG